MKCNLGSVGIKSKWVRPDEAPLAKSIYRASNKILSTYGIPSQLRISKTLLQLLYESR